MIENSGIGVVTINIELQGDNSILTEGYPPFHVNGDNVVINLTHTSGTYEFYNYLLVDDNYLFTTGKNFNVTLDGKKIGNGALVSNCTSDDGVIKYNSEYHWEDCSYARKHNVEEHSGGNATCASKAVCSVCNQEYGKVDSNNHNWLGWEYVDAITHKNTCEDNPEHTETGSHSGGTAYCYSGAICDDCSTEYTSVDSNNHDWYEWEYVDDTNHKRTCWGDESHFEVGTHNFVDGECNTCGTPNPSLYTNIIDGDVEIEGDFNIIPGINWTVSEHDGITSITINLDDVLIRGNLILPNNAGNETEQIIISTISDSRIAGDIQFENDDYRGLVNIQGNGKLEAGQFIGTGNGDKLSICTDVEIDGDLFLGASGGMDSHLEISGGTLEVDGDITLIEELYLMEDSDKQTKFIVHGHLLMHNTPTFIIEDNCEIHIMGDGNPSFYVESGTEPSWYQILLLNNTLPLGYTMKVDTDTNYFSLHDENGVVETGPVVLKNKPFYNITTTFDNTKSSVSIYTVEFGNGSVYTIANDIVTVGINIIDSNYEIEKVERVTTEGTVEIPYVEMEGYRFRMPATDVEIIITMREKNLNNNGSNIITQPSDDNDPTYRIDILEDILNGEVKSNKRYAESGEWVKLTTTANKGYELKDISVTRTNGREVEIIEEDGIYKFKMPSGRVIVNAEFVNSKIYHSENCDRGESCPIWRFDDTNANAWYHDGVHYCIEDEIMIGYGNRIFKPDAPITRSMMVTMLWRMENAPIVNYLMIYEDVDLGQWYTEAVRWATSEDIVSGYSSDKFGPDDIISREQMVTVLWRYAQYKGMDVSVGENTNIFSYDDVFDISEYAISAVQWACGEGIIKGDENKIMPKDSTTRAQVANILFRYFKIG